MNSHVNRPIPPLMSLSSDHTPFGALGGRKSRHVHEGLSDGFVEGFSDGFEVGSYVGLAVGSHVGSKTSSEGPVDGWLKAGDALGFTTGLDVG